MYHFVPRTQEKREIGIFSVKIPPQIHRSLKKQGFLGYFTKIKVDKSVDKWWLDWRKIIFFKNNSLQDCETCSLAVSTTVVEGSGRGIRCLISCSCDACVASWFSFGKRRRRRRGYRTNPRHHGQRHPLDYDLSRKGDWRP